MKDKGMEVDGVLRAEGALFTSDAPAPAAGDWTGIEFFRADGGASSLNGSTIEYAVDAVETLYTNIDMSRLTVREYSGNGVFTGVDDACRIEDSTFVSSSESGTGIFVRGQSTARHNTIDGYIGIMVGEGSPVIEENVIKVSSMGISISWDTTPTIRRNVIMGTGDSALGISAIFDTAEPAIYENDISGFFIGISLDILTADIHDNNIHSNSGWGMKSEGAITARSCFFGAAAPTSSDATMPSDINTKVTATTPRDRPVDIADMEQPPGVIIFRVWPLGGGGAGGGGGGNGNETIDEERSTQLYFLGLSPVICGVLGMMLVVLFVVVIVVVVLRRGRGKAVSGQGAAPQPAVVQFPIPVASYYHPPAIAPAPAPGAGKEPRGEDIVIEDVFLIYKDGRLLHHDTRRLKPDVDDDMLVGMFTAIQDFIKGAFPSESDDPTKNVINEIMRGDEKILIEHGRFVYLAVVARASDTKRIHARMKDIIGEMERACAKELEGWTGNVAEIIAAKQFTKRLITEAL
jgi:hypothetical protein